MSDENRKTVKHKARSLLILKGRDAEILLMIGYETMVARLFDSSKFVKVKGITGKKGVINKDAIGLLRAV